MNELRKLFPRRLSCWALCWTYIRARSNKEKILVVRANIVGGPTAANILSIFSDWWKKSALIIQLFSTLLLFLPLLKVETLQAGSHDGPISLVHGMLWTEEASSTNSYYLFCEPAQVFSPHRSAPDRFHLSPAAGCCRWRWVKFTWAENRVLSFHMCVIWIFAMWP